MKNYEEMTSDVLEKAEKILCHRRKVRNTVTISVGAFCLCMIVAFAAMMPREQAGNGDVILQQPTGTPGDLELPILPTEPTGTVCRMEGITLLAAMSSEDAGTPMQADLTLPLNYYMMVRDLRGLTKSQRDEVLNQELTLIKEKALPGSYALYSCMPRENYVISLVRNGSFMLKLEDFSTVDRIIIRSMTQYGWVDVALSDSTFPKGRSVTLYPEGIPQRDQELGIRVNWKYNKQYLDALDADPGLFTAGLSDTIHFAVDYKNGVRQEFSVWITVLPDGQVMACLLGETGEI